MGLPTVAATTLVGPLLGLFVNAMVSVGWFAANAVVGSFTPSWCSTVTVCAWFAGMVLAVATVSLSFVDPSAHDDWAAANVVT